MISFYSFLYKNKIFICSFILIVLRGLLLGRSNLRLLAWSERKVNWERNSINLYGLWFCLNRLSLRSIRLLLVLLLGVSSLLEVVVIDWLLRSSLLLEIGILLKGSRLLLLLLRVGVLLLRGSSLIEIGLLLLLLKGRSLIVLRSIEIIIWLLELVSVRLLPLDRIVLIIVSLLEWLLHLLERLSVIRILWLSIIELIILLDRKHLLRGRSLS